MKKLLKPYNVKGTSLFFIATALFVSTSAAATDLSAYTDEQKTLYAIGLTLSRSLSVFTLTPEEFKIVKQGLEDAQSGKKGDLELSVYNGKIQDMGRSRRKAASEKQVAAGKDFLEKAAKEKGAVKTSSGMVYLSLTEGQGASPKADDTIKVNYRGTIIDGTEFDSSYKRGTPLELKLTAVIPCWVEGIQKMKPGGKARFVCPPGLAYGDKGAGEQILPGATLVFDVELLEAKPAEVVKSGDMTPDKPAESSKAAAPEKK